MNATTQQKTVDRIERRLSSALCELAESKRQDRARRGCSADRAQGDPFFLGLVAGLREALIEARSCSAEAGSGEVHRVRTGYVRR